jgi:thiol-disulfide isomerase/thioredoxin
LDSAGPSQLVVAEFFVPHCPACRTLQPKLHAIAAANPDALFLHVNGAANPALTAWVEGRGITRLPWFELIRGGVVRMGLAANLTQVARLRAEIAAAKACEGECAVPR